MKLLSPQEQKNEVNKKELQFNRKILKLREEQEALIKRVNGLKDEEKKEQERIKKERGEFVGKLIAEINATLKMAEEAKARKREALRPITETMESVRVRELVVTARESEVDRREQGFEATKQSVLTLSDTFKEKEKDLGERENELKAKIKEFEGRKIHFESFMQGKEDRIKAELDKLRKLNEQSNK